MFRALEDGPAVSGESTSNPMAPCNCRDVCERLLVAAAGNLTGMEPDLTAGAHAKL